ncbi:MAG: hypothetical protein JW816_03835 [Candidatus Buchananbacteria bacterium]|nr:hypothetical protein [Candidatus Buchananbacteria bacterium]
MIDYLVKKNFFGINIFSWGTFLVIIFASILLLLNPIMLPPNFSDISYHLSVANGFINSGGVVTWNYWEAAPIGRAQLYPPLFHIILSGLLLLGINQIFLIKLVSFIIYPLILWAIWYLGKNIFNDFVGFLSVIFVAKSLPFIMTSVTVLPATLSIFLTLLIYVFLTRKKYLAAFLLMILVWYSHMFLPYFSAWLLFSYGLVNKKEFKKVLIIIFGSFIFYLPWFINVVTHLNYIKYFSVLTPFERGKNDSLFDIFLPFSFIVTFFWCLIYFFKNELFQKVLPIFIWIFPMFIIIPLYPERFFSAGGLVALAICLAVFIYLILEKNNNLILNVIFIIFIIFFDVQLIHTPEKNPVIHLRSTTFVSLINVEPNFWSGIKYNPYSQINLNLADKLKNNTNSNDIIWSKTSIFEHYYYHPETQVIIGNFFGGLANRAIANARDPEEFRPDLWQPLPVEKAAMVVAELKQTPFWNGERSQSDQQLSDILAKNFLLVDRSEILYLYKNKSNDLVTVDIVKPVVPLWLTYLLILLIVTLIFYSIYNNKLDKIFFHENSSH